MNIEHLKTFHCVAETESFTKAARKLFLTQPAVSMHIQHLEHELGVSLFDRSRRSIVLTIEGKSLYNYTRKIFDLLADLREEFTDINELQKGTLHMGATAIMGSYYLPKYVAGFLNKYPNLELNLAIDNSHNIAEMIYQQKIEYGFAGSSAVHPGLQQSFLHREPLVLVTGKNSPLTNNSGLLTADDLLQESFIMREQGTRMTDKVTDWFRMNSQEKKTPSLVTVNNMVVTKEIVANGFGITALPRHAAETELQSGELVQLSISGFKLYVNYFLVCMKGQRLSKVARRFLLYLFEQGVSIPEELVTK